MYHRTRWIQDQRTAGGPCCVSYFLEIPAFPPDYILGIIFCLAMFLMRIMVVFLMPVCNERGR